MTLLTATFESGTNGSAPVASGAEGFFSVSSGCTYDSTNFFHGGMGLSVVGPSTTATYVAWQNVAGASNVAAARMYFKIPSLPTSSNAFLHFRSAGGGSGLVDIVSNSVGQLLVSNEVTSTSSTATTGSLSTNTWYRLEAQITNGTTTTGAITVNCYLGDSTTAISNLAISMTAQNFGTATIGTFRYGKATGTSGAQTLYLDDLAAQTGSNSAIGPSPSTLGLMKLGSGAINNMHVGSGVVSKAYIGANQIWP